MSDQAFIQKRSQHPVREEKVYTFKHSPEMTVYYTDPALGSRYVLIRPDDDGYYRLSDGLYVIKMHRIRDNEEDLHLVAVNVVNGEPHIVFRAVFHTMNAERDKKIMEYLNDVLPWNISLYME